VRELKNAVERAVIMATGPTITVTDIAPRHLRPGMEGTDPYGAPATPPRRRASDRVVAGQNGSATVLGMTRDELFEAFSQFVSKHREAPRAVPAVPEVVFVEEDASSDDESGDAVVAERVQPAKAHAKPKTKKRR
jgi:DNA-binding NtrC family response regulator